MSEEDRFVKPEDVETLEFDWGRIKWLSTPDVTGSERLSAGIVQLAPKEGHERHNHPDSEEILYAISGEGIQTVDGDERRITAWRMSKVISHLLGQGSILSQITQTVGGCYSAGRTVRLGKYDP